MLIGKKLYIPDQTKAVLWDMDGVLIDSLGFDVDVVNKLAQKYFGKRVVLSRWFIKSIFAYDPQIFWVMIFRRISKIYKIKTKDRQLSLAVKEYNQIRLQIKYRLCPGVHSILTELNKKNIKQAVVSNNPVKDVRKILENSSIAEQFDLIIGNDRQSLHKKPAPDTYLLAMKKLGLTPEECVVIEDTAIGVQAGKVVGCYTIGVATGGASKYQLHKIRPAANKIYFELN